MAQRHATGDEGVMFEQWIEDQRDLGLLVVENGDIGTRSPRALPHGAGTRRSPPL
jgi:hypothetical protein